MSRSFALVCFIAILALCCTHAHAREVSLFQQRMQLATNCVIDESSVIARLVGECEGEEFELTPEAYRSVKDRNGQVITSWEAFLQFRKEFKAPFFKKNIAREFFREYDLGVVYVWYTGSRVIKNEKLYKTNDECGFTYEVWDTKMPAPACVWQVLYVLKLRKAR